MKTKNWLATRAARNLTLLPKQNLAKTTKNLTHTHHNEDWSTKDKGSKNKPLLHWVCARETKKTKPTKLYTELQKVGKHSQKLAVCIKGDKKKKERKIDRNLQTWRIRIHSSLQSEIFKVSLWWPFKKMLRSWKTENRHTQTLKMMTAWQPPPNHNPPICTHTNPYCDSFHLHSLQIWGVHWNWIRTNPDR